MGAMEKVLPFLFTLTVVFLTNLTLTMLSPDKNKTKYFRLRLPDEVSTERPETDLRLT